MKNVLICFCLVLSGMAHSASYTFLIENPSDFERKDQPVVLTVAHFGGAIPAGFPVAHIKSTEVPVQADDFDGNGKTDEIALTVDLKANQKIELKLKFEPSPSEKVFPKRVHAQLFKVENNQVSVGALKGWDGKKIIQTESVASRTTRILADGPVRTVVDMVVENWKYQKQTIQLTSRYIMYAGHRDIEMVHYVNAPDLKILSFCTGVQKFPEMTVCNKDQIIAVWGRNPAVRDTIGYEKDTVGLAVYCPEKMTLQPKQDKNNFLFMLRGLPVIRYYTTAYWKKEDGGLKTGQEFFDILPLWKRSLEESILVRVKR